MAQRGGGGAANYQHIPSVTRVYTTAAVQMEPVSPFQIYFNPDLIFKRLQIWRLVTNFLYFGRLGFSFLFNMVFTYRYCKMLEETSFRGRTADFVFMFLFGGLIITALQLGTFTSFLRTFSQTNQEEKKLLVTPAILKQIFDDPPSDPSYNHLPEDIVNQWYNDQPPQDD